MMKVWNTPVVENVEIVETNEGGKFQTDFDARWVDENGKAFQTYPGEGS